MKKDAEARMVERRRSWHEKSSQLEQRARHAARSEIDQLNREIQLEEQAIAQKIERKFLFIR